MPCARPLAALLAAALVALEARAAEPELAHSRRDLVVAGVAAATALTLELAKGELAPESCRICGGNRFDDGARRLLVWSHTGRARLASNVAVAVVPVAGAAYVLFAGQRGNGGREGLWDGVAVAEAASLTMALTSVVKLAAARQRPFVAHGNWPDPDRRPDPDDNLALWSGHTALSFAVAASAGTIASMRGRGEAPWVWATGLTAAAAVGWFRIGADEHHLTDVLAGAAVGTALGIAVPRLLHRRREGPGGVSVALVPLPLGMAGTF